MAYTGSYKFGNTGNFYIHRHIQNIGRANHENAMGDSELVNMYEESRKKAGETVKKQFLNLFQGSLDKKGYQLMSMATDTEAFVSSVGNELADSLIKVLDTNKMQALMNIEKDVTRDLFNNIFKVKDSKDGQSAEEALESFNKLLEILSQAMDLITGDKNNSVRLALGIDPKTGMRTMAEMGDHLASELQKFFDQANTKGMGLTGFQIAQVNHVISTLQSLVHHLKTGKTTGNENISASGMYKNILKNVFSTGFAQAISGDIRSKATTGVIQNIQKVALIGSRQVEFALTDENGNIISTVAKSNAAGKADVILKNVRVNLTKTGSDTSSTIGINVGISDKFYKNAYFPGVEQNTINNAFSLGSGGKLTTILNMLSSEERYQYLTFNVISASDHLPNAIQAFHKAILTRDIVYLISTRGGQSDFVQFIFANNQLVPVWDIIQNVINSTTGFSDSQRETVGSSSSQAVFISFGDGRYKAIEAWNSLTGISQVQRVRRVNSAIRSIRLSGHVNLNKLNSSSIHTA